MKPVAPLNGTPPELCKREDQRLIDRKKERKRESEREMTNHVNKYLGCLQEHTHRNTVTSNDAGPHAIVFVPTGVDESDSTASVTTTRPTMLRTIVVV